MGIHEPHKRRCVSRLKLLLKCFPQSSEFRDGRLLGNIFRIVVMLEKDVLNVPRQS